jgi:uncharacterized membrane protein YfcA
MIVAALQSALAVAAVVLALAWWRALQRLSASRATTPEAILLGFFTNFFDTLGIGSFAPTTAWLKLRSLITDDLIPGTLNVGHALPTIAQALIFIALVAVDPTLLLACVLAATVGAWFGAGLVAGLPVRVIRVGMACALLVGATLFAAANLGLLPAGGTALSLTGAGFWIAVAAHAVLGALMTLGIGLYAPSLILLSLLGLEPKGAFPIMMGACALLMPVGSLRFLQGERWSPRLALGLALGGIPAVLIAAFVVKSLPLEWLRWLVVVVVAYAAVAMLRGSAAVPRLSASNTP